MAFKTRAIPQQNGGWFKPADYPQESVILVEVKALDRQRPTPNGPKDSALVDLTFFKSEESLSSGEPDEVLVGTRIEQTVLARDLFALDVGDATINTISQVPSKRGLNPSWVWRPVTAAVEKQVVAYGEAREAALEKALADVPDFGDEDGDGVA